MRAIGKGREPVELGTYRAYPGTTYDGPNFTPVKDRIREELLKEQGHLCAYCMQRIEDDCLATKVEHWRSRKAYPAEQLDYRNLLACCNGNEGEPPGSQHCDTRKGECDLSLSPADPAHHPRLGIRYDGFGTIRSAGDQFDRELNDVLNLNWHRLRKNRRGVWKAVTMALSCKGGRRTRPEIQKLLARWQRHDAAGRLQEYCGVAAYYLEKKLAQMAT